VNVPKKIKEKLQSFIKVFHNGLAGDSIFFFHFCVLQNHQSTERA
jgi:hypothetical protein